MAKLFVIVAVLCFVAYAKAGGGAEVAFPALDYGLGGYGTGYGGYGYPAVAAYDAPSTYGGVLGDGSYIPGAGFIPGYPFTYLRDSYGGHLPPEDIHATSIYTQAAPIYKAAPVYKSAPLLKTAAPIYKTPLLKNFSPYYASSPVFTAPIAGYGYGYDSPLLSYEAPVYEGYRYRR